MRLVEHLFFLHYPKYKYLLWKIIINEFFFVQLFFLYNYLNYANRHTILLIDILFIIAFYGNELGAIFLPCNLLKNEVYYICRNLK